MSELGEQVKEQINDTQKVEEGGIQIILDHSTITMQSFRNSVSSELTKGLSVIRSWTQNGMDQLIMVTKTLRNEAEEFSRTFEVKEWLSMEGLFYVTLVFVAIVSFLTISLNIYRKIRHAIPATVNCWFCNSNSKVLYSLRDTWTCPKCQQYNGFTSDGNYNKRIPAQFIEALNRPVRGRPAAGHHVRRGGSANELCSQCNLNQVLKVFQLASFVPVNERNFDVEIEAEQKRLEQLYDICPQCKLVVEEVLKKKPEKQLPIKRINKVSPHNDELFGDTSNSSLESSFLSLDNLKIGQKNRNYSPNSPPCFSHYGPTDQKEMPIIFQSSQAGDIFAGRKPLIYPPKLTSSFVPYVRYGSSFVPYVRYGSYWDVHFSPISRRSSESSGFVSYTGCMNKTCCNNSFA